MPALRQCLKHPGTYLLALTLLFLAAAADGIRPPQRQWTAPAYIKLIQAYRGVVSPLVSQCARCRFHPTCSVYSARAVSALGIYQGLALTVDRLARCRTSVPMGTLDPPPAAPDAPGLANHLSQAARP